MRHIEGVEVSLRSIITLALNGDERLKSCTSCFTRRKRSPVLTELEVSSAPDL